MTRYVTLEGAKQLFEQSGAQMVTMPEFDLELECVERTGDVMPPTISLRGRLSVHGYVSIYQCMLKMEEAQKVLSELYAKHGFPRTRTGAEEFAKFIREGDVIPGLEQLQRRCVAVYEPQLFDEDWGSWFDITYVPTFEK